MASRSTRNRIKWQSRQARKCLDKALEHLAKCDMLSGETLGGQDLLPVGDMLRQGATLCLCVPIGAGIHHTFPPQGPVGDVLGQDASCRHLVGRVGCSFSPRSSMVIPAGDPVTAMASLV